jgi:parallel beta-helix repeat protein
MRANACFTSLLVSAVTFLASIAFGGSPTFISGNQSGTLYLTNSPYIVTSDIVVPFGQTLTIEAGVEVQFTNFNIGAFVDGTLIARGTAGTPILFTSDKVTKQPGQWKVLCFRSGFNSVLENCIIECGAGLGSGFVENVRVESFVAPLLTNCLFRLASGNGLTVYGGDPRIQNCAFNNNTNLAIAMRGDSLPILQGNSASGNGRNAIGVFGYYIPRTGTWFRDNIPYTIYEEAQLNEGVTLTIEPGTVIQFERPFDALYVAGTLIARGTPLNPILFTSDDTVKQPGQWRVISFRGTAGTNSVMENCIVECAAAPIGGYNANIAFENPTASVLITNCIVRHSFANGMTILGSDPRVLACTFTNNGATNNGLAIAMRGNCLPVFRNNTAVGNGRNAIGIFGYYITRTGTWVRDNIPYTVYEEAFINNGVTLTIEPGTTVQFERTFDGLYVEGTLVARGTPGNPILFTSDDPAKQPGQWRVISFRATAGTNSVMENCVVECAAASGAGYNANIVFETTTASVLITNCIIRHSFANGMTILGSDPRVLACTFTNNGATNNGLAIAMRGDCLPVFRNNTALDNGRNAIGIFGYYITRTGTWVRDNIPYTIYEEAFVNNGVTLTIEPGTVIQFERTFDGFYIEGTLVARGTAGNPILFTSDDSAKQPGQWRVLQFRTTAGVGSIMENCIIEYGASAAGGYNGSLQFDTAPAILITNCTIRNSTVDGIFCNGSSPFIRDCRINDNTRDGIRTFNGSSPIVSGSVISGNIGFGVNNLDTTRIINAEANYWGHPSGPLDNSNVDGLGLSNPGGLGDKVSEYVDWSPFLNSAPTNSEVPAVLIISKAGNSQVTVSWPSAATGYSLQSVTNLSIGSNSWSAVTNVPVLIADRYTVTQDLTGLPMFYRLIK